MRKQTLRRAGIKGYWFRGLRHIFATRLTSRSAAPPTVQELLGHNTLSMVMRYAHPTTDHKRNAVELLANDVETVESQNTFTTNDALESAHFLPIQNQIHRLKTKESSSNTLRNNSIQQMRQ